jgi:probable HAF family extracellular repeat protein
MYRSPSGQVTQFSSPEGGSRNVVGVNSSGAVLMENSGNYLFVNGVPQLLDTAIYPGANIRATGINDSGVIVGTLYGVPGLLQSAFIFDGATTTILPSLGNETAYAVNNSGAVTGEAYAPAPTAGTEAFLYSGGVFMYLGSLGGIRPGNGPSSRGLAISSNGLVVGDSLTASSAIDAFLWDGSMHDLGVLGGDACAPAPCVGSKATGVNRFGQVVGSLYPNGSYSPTAFLYEAGQMEVLSQPNHGLRSAIRRKLVPAGRIRNQ